MNILQGIYSLGLQIDKARKNKKKLTLSAPVLSVGNISVGGRAKTPFVIDICKYLKEKGYEPVVLTRGYARNCKEDIWLLPEVLSQLENLTADKAGDEAIEIYLGAQVAVLVSANRAEQALKYLRLQEKISSHKKTIFVLDDGFQHWLLERDADIVLVNEEDFKDTLLPTGRLRESVAALERADLVLQLAKDFQKEMKLNLQGEILDPNTCIAVTTRAGSQKKYQQDLSALLKLSIPLLDLRDHLNTKSLQEKIFDLPKGITQLLLGMKEAVKLLDPSSFRKGEKAFHTLNIESRSFKVYIVELELVWDRSRIENLLMKKGIH